MRSMITLSAICFITFLYSCTHNSVVNTNNESEFKSNSPFSIGPFEYSEKVIDTTFPDYMEEVKEIDIRYPISSSLKPYPTIIIEPGFFSESTDLEDIKNRYASHGFLVIGMTNTSHYKLITTSLEPYRIAIEQTIKYAIECNRDSANLLFGLIDTNAIGISGHSMGGGGVLMVCNSDSSTMRSYVKSAIAMNPFGNCDASNIDIPIFIFSSDKDKVINPFMIGKTSKPEDIYSSFESLPMTTERLFSNYKDMDHNGVVDYKLILPTSGNAETFLPAMICWFKVHLSNDTTFAKYLDEKANEFEELKSCFTSHEDVPDYIYFN